MTDHGTVPPLLDFEAFGAAVGIAIVCGALSVMVPLLVAPTATLAALAVAGWVSLSRHRGVLTRNGLSKGPIAGLLILGGATVGFLLCPPILVPFRGLVLAGGLVPLFAFERARSAPPAPEFSRP
jgi:hypothetical protein